MPRPVSGKEFLNSLQELTCAICEESFDATHSPITVDGCRHVFGAECLRAWTESTSPRHNTCPTCRRVMFDTSQHTSQRSIQHSRLPTQAQLPVQAQYVLDARSPVFEQLQQLLRNLGALGEVIQRDSRSLVNTTVERRQAEQRHRERRHNGEEQQTEQLWRYQHEAERQQRKQQRRADKQRHSIARQDQDRIIGQTQQEEQQEVQGRLEQARRREEAYGALTTNVMYSTEGILYQFLSYSVMETAEKVAEAFRPRHRLVGLMAGYPNYTR